MTLKMDIQALAFDVFGTVVDWHGSVIREGQTQWTDLDLDWVAFVDDWRNGYQPAMDNIRSGQAEWTKIDTIHRQILDALLEKYQVTGLTEPQKDHLNRIWHRLDPWPDAQEGLRRIRTEYKITTLSNGNVSLLVDLARYGGLVWDCILSSELAKKYKPDHEVYQLVPDLFDVPRESVLMVASHTMDLYAAKQVGLKTAFVRRPMEFGLHGTPETPNEADFDLIVDDFIDLASQLGV